MKVGGVVEDCAEVQGGQAFLFGGVCGGHGEGFVLIIFYLGVVASPLLYRCVVGQFIQSLSRSVDNDTVMSNRLFDLPTTHPNDLEPQYYG